MQLPNLQNGDTSCTEIIRNLANSLLLLNPWISSVAPHVDAVQYKEMTGAQDSPRLTSESRNCQTYLSPLVQVKGLKNKNEIDDPSSYWLYIFVEV